MPETRNIDQYCTKCGEKTIVVSYIEAKDYNPHNGKKDIYVRKYKCPNKRFWLDGHSGL
jgi:hypothetical protein